MQPEQLAIHFVDYLNDLMGVDAAAIEQLVECRAPCNAELAAHCTVQVRDLGDGQWRVGLLGILNGFVGTRPGTKAGYIAGVFDETGVVLQGFRVVPGGLPGQQIVLGRQIALGRHVDGLVTGHLVRKGDVLEICEVDATQEECYHVKQLDAEDRHSFRISSRDVAEFLDVPTSIKRRFKFRNRETGLLLGEHKDRHKLRYYDSTGRLQEDYEFQGEPVQAAVREDGALCLQRRRLWYDDGELYFLKREDWDVQWKDA